MGKPVQIALAVTLVVLVGVMVSLILSDREPAYQGKPLSGWLEQYATNHWSPQSGGELDKKAQTAIRQLGTNEIPRYLSMMTSRESPLKAKLMALVPGPWRRHLHLRSAYEYRILGAYGLIVLGEEGKSAVPFLIVLLSDSDPDVRYPAVFALRSLGPLASEALPSIIKCLTDPDVRVQSDAILALGQIHEQPQLVIPILIDNLDNPQSRNNAAALMRSSALWSLCEFREQAKPAIPNLIRLLNDENPNFRMEVTNALRIIDSEAAQKPE